MSEESPSKLEGLSSEAVKMGLTDSTWAYMSKGYFLSFRRVADRSNVVNFISFVEQFSDSYNSNFSQEVVFGRTDPLQRYQNTQRSITLSWALVGYNEDSAARNLQDTNRLVQLLYPGYTKHGTQKIYKTSPVVEMQYINLVNEQMSYLPGTVSTFSFTPDLEFGVFENSYQVLTPKVLRLSISFNPLHKTALGFTEGSKNFPESNFPYFNTSDTSTDPQELTNYIEKSGELAPEQNLYEQFTQAKEDEILSAYNLGSDPWKSPIFGKPDGD